MLQQWCIRVLVEQHERRRFTSTNDNQVSEFRKFFLWEIWNLRSLAICLGIRRALLASPYFLEFLKRCDVAQVSVCRRRRATTQILWNEIMDCFWLLKGFQLAVAGEESTWNASCRTWSMRRGGRERKILFLNSCSFRTAQFVHSFINFCELYTIYTTSNEMLSSSVGWRRNHIKHF